MASFGEVFTKNVQFYTYPDQKEGTGELIDTHNLIVPDGVKFLYKHIVDNKQVVDIVDVKKQYLHIYSSDVIRLLKNDEGAWEQMVPKRVAELIKAKNLFGFPCEKVDLSINGYLCPYLIHVKGILHEKNESGRIAAIR